MTKKYVSEREGGREGGREGRRERERERERGISHRCNLDHKYFQGSTLEEKVKRTCNHKVCHTSQHTIEMSET